MKTKTASYWRKHVQRFRQKVCCGIVYKGRFGEVLIDPHLYKPCCQRKPQLQQEQGEEMEEEAEEEQSTGLTVSTSSPSGAKEEEEEEVEKSGQPQGGARWWQRRVCSLPRWTDWLAHDTSQIVHMGPHCRFFFLLFQTLATLPDCQIPTTPAGLDLWTGSVFIFSACYEILSFCKYLIFLSVGNAGSMNAAQKPGTSGICDWLRLDRPQRGKAKSNLVKKNKMITLSLN